MSEIRRMPVSEFVTLGYLQELNRRFLHPLGLALEVEIEEDGDVRFGGVWDYRDDPEGMAFSDFSADDVARGDRISNELKDAEEMRKALLGWFIQPLVVTKEPQ